MIYKMKIADSVDEMVFDLLEVPIEDKDIEGTADNTTIDGNVFTDYLWLKKQFTQKWSLMCKDDYTQLRGFYTRQWENAEVPTYKLYYGENISELVSKSGSYIQATNSTALPAQIEDFKMKGKTSQATYTGKNLLNMPITSGGTNGITWSVQNDGSIIINGTTTAATSIRANNVSMPATEGETYTLSATGLNNIVNFGYKNAGNGSNILVATPSTPDATAQITSTMLSQANRLDMYISSGKSFNYQRITLQFVKGSTAGDYEPYVGAKASPNPDYPQWVNTTTGENVVRVMGKNWFNKNGSLLADRRISVSNGGTYVSNGYSIANYVQINPSTTYVLTTGGIARSYFSWYDDEKIFISGGFWDDGQTQTSPSNAVYVRFDFATADVGGVMLEIGTSATNYGAYQAQECEINLGKNLLPTRGAYTKTSSDIKFTVDDEGFTLDGTASANVDFYIIGDWNNRTISYGKVPNGMVQLSLYDSDYNLVSTAPFGVKVYDRLGANSNGFLTFNATESGTKTANLPLLRNITACYISIPSGASFDNEKFYVQLERGLQSTSFAPYSTPIELAKIDTHQDYIYKSGSDWYIHKEVGKKIFDGSENWGDESQYSRYYTQVSDAPSETVRSMIYSDYYHFVSIYGSEGAGFAYANKVYLYWGTTSNNVSDFKTWLASHPTSVYYILATPTDTKITDSTLIGQLDDILTASLYVGENNIMTLTANVEPTLDIEYRLIFSQETIIRDTTPVRLTLTDGGVINPCECRQNVQITMRETTQ